MSEDQPYTTLKNLHSAVFDKLKTDERLTTQYRIDTWDQGRFDMQSLPPTGIHARYQRASVTPLEETTGYYTYRVEVIVWLLINQGDPIIQYDLAEMYLGRIKEIMTDMPDDWSVNGTITNITMGRTEYAQDWNSLRHSMLLCASVYTIWVDVVHG
jgi:hypothetical protein